MSDELKVKRLDSPLSRNSDRGRNDRADAEPEKKAVAPKRPRTRSAAPRKPALASVPAQAPNTQPSAPEDAMAALPDPPPLSEPLELLSTRLPATLRRSVSELTAALRARGEGRQSQKALPEQELLAVLIWLAGDPEDPAAIERLGRALDAYRGRRYAAEARSLGA